MKLVSERRKPLLTVWMGEKSVREARALFRENEIPTYPTPEEAVKAYMYMCRYRRNLDLLYETPEELPVDVFPAKGHLKLAMQKAKDAGRRALTVTDVDRFLEAYGIPRAPGSLAKNLDQALMIASEVGFPIVIKIASQDILHKTDVDGIISGIDSSEALRTQFPALIERIRKAKPEARVDGVYVQKMLTRIDFELIIGSEKDRDFGAVILFGFGGIGVEIFKDFAIGLPPLNQVLARRIMEETRIYEALAKGLRHKPPADMRLLEEILVRFSNMIVDFPEIAEIDINPLAVSDGKPWALDARIVIDSTSIDRADHPHLVIMPYPTKYVTPWTLNDGTQVIIRPIRPEDELMELEFIRGLSPETSRFRFFQIIKDLPHEALVRFCNIDYDREMAFIAETRESNRRVEIGVARLILDPSNTRGEIAVVVADKHQGKGLGTKLMDMLIEFGKEKGVGSIYGIIIPENMAMIRFCKRLGFTTRRYQDNVTAELNFK